MGLLKHRVVPAGLESLERTSSNAALVPAEVQQSSSQLVCREPVHKTVGRRAFWDAVEVYRRMWIVVGIFLVCNFVYYAAISHFVPNVLCLDPIKNARGTTKTFLDCVYVTDGDYSKNTGRKVLFLLFWAAQWSWLTFVAALFGSAVFGYRHFRTYEKCIIGSINITVFLLTVVGCLTRGWAVNKPLVQLYLPVSTGFITTIFSGRAGSRRCRNPVMVFRWFFLMTVIGMVTVFYAFAMPRLVTTRATPSQKMLVRLIIHPAIWSVMLMFMRQVGRHIGLTPGMQQMVLFTYPYVYKTMYGRFLLLQISSNSATVALNVLTCVLELVGQLADRTADGMLLSLLYGKRAANAISATDEATQWRAAETLANSLGEYVSIIAGGALNSFANVTGQAGVGNNNGSDWWTAALQFITFMITDFIGVCIDMKYHKFDFLKHMPRRPTGIVGYLMLTQLFGSTRLCFELILLFCPRYYDQFGVLLEVCNQASVFDHLRPWRLAGAGAIYG